MSEAKQIVLDFVIRYGFQFIGACVILTTGFFLSKWAGQLLVKGLSRHQMEPPVRTLIVRVVRLVIMALVTVIALDKFGIQVAPLVAGIGVVGVGVGLALQGVLGNLVAGLFIIFTKPYRVGEYIELLGVQGEVSTIDLFSTILLHPDRSRVVVPNRKIVGEILHNFGTTRQLSLTFSVSYDTNISAAIQLIRSVVDAHPDVLKDPVAPVGVGELGDSGITISAMPWVAVKDVGRAKPDLYQKIHEKLVAAGVNIPFPQQEIRLLNPFFQQLPEKKA